MFEGDPPLLPFLSEALFLWMTRKVSIGHFSSWKVFFLPEKNYLLQEFGFFVSMVHMWQEVSCSSGSSPYTKLSLCVPKRVGHRIFFFFMSEFVLSQKKNRTGDSGLLLIKGCLPF